MNIAVLGIKRVPAIAGADRVAELILRAASASDSYTVYVMRDGTPRPAVANRRYVEVPAARGKHAAAATYFLLSSLHAAFLGNADVAHVHNSDFGVFCLILRLRRRPRIVGTLHGDPYRRAKWGWLARLALRFSERCFFTCCDVLTSVTPIKTMDRRDIKYVPNGVDPWAPDVRTRARVLRRLRATTREFVMFACGRLDRTKGLHHLLRAYPDLPQAPPLIAVGDFTHDGQYSRTVERLAAADVRVRLHPELLPRNELFEAASAAKVFVFPSELEGMSMMLLEAIGAGALVVCSDIPENVEVVGSDYPLLFKNRDHRALAQVLATALRTTDEDGLRENLQSRVTTRFRWDKAAAEYSASYADASSAHRRVRWPPGRLRSLLRRLS